MKTYSLMLMLYTGLSINNYAPQTWKLLVSAILFLSTANPHVTLP